MKILTKILFITLALAAILPATAWAQAAPGDSTDVIGAQLNVTRSAVDQLIRKLGERQEQNQFNVRDYKATAPVFQERVEEGLLRFEEAMKGSIMKKLGFWVDRYNQIYDSPDFSADQKTTLLQKQYDVIQSQLVDIQKEYRGEIFKVYQLVGNLPYQLKAWSNNHYDFKGKCKGRCLEIKKSLSKEARSYLSEDSDHRAIIFEPRYFVRNPPAKPLDSTQVILVDMPYGYIADEISEGREFFRERGSSSTPPEEYVDYLRALFEATVFPVISNGCRSQLCVGLNVSDIGFFTGLVSKTIDRPIVIELKDKKKLTISNLQLKLGFFDDLLNITDYPVELPFDTEP